MTSNDCQISLIESDGLICESNSLWKERKSIYDIQNDENIKKRPHTFYFANNWEPNFHCAYTRRIGSMGDGGKWICDPYRLKLRSDCLIYSVGSSGDFSFEIEFKKSMPHCEIHTFDKDSYSCPTNVCAFHQMTFGNGIEPKHSQDWLTIINKLNHTHRLIDILKLDIEGGEYVFFPLMFTLHKNTWPRQILTEFHPRNVTTVHEMFELFGKKNYVIFSKENNLEGGPYFFEYGFLKLNSQFFVRFDENISMT